MLTMLVLQSLQTKITEEQAGDLSAMFSGHAAIQQHQPLAHALVCDILGSIFTAILTKEPPYTDEEACKYIQARITLLGQQLSQEHQRN
jgi:hypothetical protein